MKKILIFSPHYYPQFPAGASVLIKEITDRITSEVIEFHMVTLQIDTKLPKIEQIGNVLVHRIGITKSHPSMADLEKFPLSLNMRFFQIFAAWKALRLHKKYHYDAIWSVTAHTSAAPAAIFKIFHPFVPYLLTLEEGDSVDYLKKKSFLSSPFFTRGFTHANRVHTISTFLGQWARDMGFAGPLDLIPGAVNVANFSRTYPTEDIDKLKQELGKQPGDVFLITTSRLVRKNAIDEVIRALTFLPAHVKFLILGVGADEAILRTLAKDQKVSDRVMFVGHVNHDDMPKYFSISDIFIRPSRSEGLGNSFLEAMAAGLPVIATPVGGIPDFLFDPGRTPNIEPTGLFCDVDNPESIATQVKRLLSDNELRLRIIANGRKLVGVRETYDWSLSARAMKEKVFDELKVS